MLRKKAFTLLEIMIALLVAGLTLLPTLDLLIKSYGLTNRQVDQGFALNLADSALNLVRSTKFTIFSAAIVAEQTLRMEIKFPGEAVAKVLDVPIGIADAAKQGVRITHEGSITDYFVKLELKRISGEADGVTTIFNYGRCGYMGGVGAAVSTFSAQYSTKEEIYTVWAVVTCVSGKSVRKFTLSTCVADLGT